MSVFGFIASQSGGWLFCLLLSVELVGWMVGAWLDCRLVCLLSGLSVGRSNHPAGVLSNLSLTDHYPSIYVIANLPTIGTGVRRIPISSDRLAAVGLPGPCLQVTGQIWGLFYLDSQRDIPTSSIPG